MYSRLRPCNRLGANPRNLRSCASPRGFSTFHSDFRLRTLAIETSCDDTSVAVLAISNNGKPPSSSSLGSSQLVSDVLFHERITSSSAGYGGIHPLVALHSHHNHLAGLVKKAIRSLENDNVISPTGKRRHIPDFVSVTRGPGMRSNLSVGLDTAKGLALAWDVPLVGVHHMQAHALTPRLCHTLHSNTAEVRQSRGSHNEAAPLSSTMVSPSFPFLSVLVSGGHTMLIDSQSLLEHRMLAETSDIAIGDCLDKAARAILPAELLVAPYGRALEEFAFPNGAASYDYSPPLRRQDELERRETKWGWAFNPPLADSKAGGGKSSRRMVYSFTGISTYSEQVMTASVEHSIDEVRDLARETLRVAFEHLASRIMLHLTSLPAEQQTQLNTIVVSGGVASNHFLRHVLRAILDARGFGHVRLEFPPIELCTDNALMIAWAGMEMFTAGYESDLSIGPLRKWSVDPASQDGGILGVGGWRKRKTPADIYD